MKEEKTCKTKMETSKLLLWVLLGGLGVISICTLVSVFIFRDTSPLITLIECSTKLVTIAVGFYYWKAKCENLQKYKQTKKIEMGDNYEK